MPELYTQASIRPARDLPFCYLCGEPIGAGENSPDHVPPRAIFAMSDRDFPLKVAAHTACNNPQSEQDEIIGQLVAVIHGKHPEPERARLDPHLFKTPDSETPFLAFIGTNVVGQIWRWVRGFHAALYSEFLPEDTRTAVHSPFPSGIAEDDGFTIEKIKGQQYLFVWILKKNRIAHRLDRVVCYNGKCVYECVWMRMDNGSWACVFGLEIYKWTELADKHFPTRGCVGLYQPLSGRPRRGTESTTIEFPFLNLEPLDPFGS
jgi:hypothetical protein